MNKKTGKKSIVAFEKAPGNSPVWRVYADESFTGEHIAAVDGVAHCDGNNIFGFRNVWFDLRYDPDVVKENIRIAALKEEARQVAEEMTKTIADHQIDPDNRQLYSAFYELLDILTIKDVPGDREMDFFIVQFEANREVLIRMIPEVARVSSHQMFDSERRAYQVYPVPEYIVDMEPVKDLVWKALVGDYLEHHIKPAYIRIVEEMFLEDFDIIDFNKMKYLIETRMCGFLDHGPDPLVMLFLVLIIAARSAKKDGVDDNN